MNYELDVTELLEAWNVGDPQAPDRVLPLVYDQLRSIASAYFHRERRPLDLLALDEALAGLAQIDGLKASIVELRFFGGLTIAETASYLEIAPAAVVRHWDRARAWLYRQLSADDAAGDAAT